MFRKLDGKDFPEEIVNTVINPQYDRFDRFVLEFLVPEAVAYYMASGYRANAVWNSTFDAHVNSILDSLNETRPTKRDFLKVKKESKRILKIKYGITVRCEDPIDFECDY